MEVVCIPLVSALRKNDGDNEAIKTKGFGEDQNKDHTNEDVFLGVGTDTGITDDTDGEASGQGGETDAEAGSQEFVSILGSEGRGIARDVTVEDDANDKTVDTEDTSHNNGDKGLVDEVWLEDTDGADTNTGLGSTVGGTQVYITKLKTG